MFRTPSPHRDVAEVRCSKEAVTNSRSPQAVPSCCRGHRLPKALCLCYTCTMNTPPSLQACRHCIRLPNRGTSSKKARIYSAWQGKTSTSLSNTRNLSANMQRRPIQKEIHATEKRTGPQDGCFCTRLFGHTHAYSCTHSWACVVAGWAHMQAHGHRCTCSALIYHLVPTGQREAGVLFTLEDTWEHCEMHAA